MGHLLHRSSKSAVLITLDAPLLHDSYAHVAEAATETFSQALAYFTHPSANDLFFRPLGYLSYWLDYRWAGTNATLWHFSNLLLHIANCCLVYLLTRRFGLKPFAAAVAAVIFACHGSRPEVVSWAAARFDLLAAFFILLSLLAFDEYVTTERASWGFGMTCCAVLALLSKESAYCLPFLAVAFIPFKDHKYTRTILSGAFLLLAVCAGVFLYRYSVVGGIGGYRTAAGKPALFQFNLLLSLKGLLFRQWGFLFFPINWSADIGVWIKVALVLMLAVMLGFMIWSNAKRELLIAAIVVELLAVLPVHHLLLMRADEAGARVLYLPVLGLALLWGLLVQNCENRRMQMLLAAGLLAFQVVVLCHNLLIWRGVAFLSQRTCRAIGVELAKDPRPIVVRALPVTWHGVFFLRNGFPQCAAMNSHQPAGRVSLEAEGTPPSNSARLFSWCDRTERLEEMRANTK